jgi:hypothetical protein
MRLRSYLKNQLVPSRLRLRSIELKLVSCAGTVAVLEHVRVDGRANAVAITASNTSPCSAFGNRTVTNETSKLSLRLPNLGASAGRRFFHFCLLVLPIRRAYVGF